MLERRFRVVEARSGDSVIGWHVREYWPWCNFAWLWGEAKEGVPKGWLAWAEENCEHDLLSPNVTAAPGVPVQFILPDPFTDEDEARELFDALRTAYEATFDEATKERLLNESLTSSML